MVNDAFRTGAMNSQIVSKKIVIFAWIVGLGVWSLGLAGLALA